MRAPQEIQEEIIATNGKLGRLRKELNFAEHFRGRQGWVGIRRTSELCVAFDEDVVFPVNGEIVWLEWYGFIAANGKLAVAFDTTSGKQWKHIGYGEKLDKFMSWAVIGFFKTEAEARKFAILTETYLAARDK